MRVLLVHPSSEVVDSVSALLEKEDFEVSQATSTAEALERFGEARRFDVVVTALEIENDQSGFEVLTAAFSADLFAEVMVLSRRADVKTAVEAMKRGCFDFAMEQDLESLADYVVEKVRAATRQRHNDMRAAERWSQLSGKSALRS
jgi:DNA-binding NtrC family response regulator